MAASAKRPVDVCAVMNHTFASGSNCSCSRTSPFINGKLVPQQTVASKSIQTARNRLRSSTFRRLAETGSARQLIHRLLGLDQSDACGLVHTLLHFRSGCPL